MPLIENLAQWGIRAGKTRPGRVGLGLGIGYLFTPHKDKPHPIRDVAHGTSLMMTGDENMWDNYMSGMGNYVGRPMIGGALFPHSYMPEFQWGFSAMSHEGLNARYGGPNPNSDAALFVNNFDNSTGAYIGPTVGQSMGARSSAMNLGATGAMVFGMYNNRLSG